MGNCSSSQSKSLMSIFNRKGVMGVIKFIENNQGKLDLEEYQQDAKEVALKVLTTPLQHHRYLLMPGMPEIHSFEEEFVVIKLLWLLMQNFGADIHSQNSYNSNIEGNVIAQALLDKGAYAKFIEKLQNTTKEDIDNKSIMQNLIYLFTEPNREKVHKDKQNIQKSVVKYCNLFKNLTQEIIEVIIKCENIIVKMRELDESLSQKTETNPEFSSESQKELDNLRVRNQELHLKLLEQKFISKINLRAGYEKNISSLQDSITKLQFMLQNFPAYAENLEKLKNFCSELHDALQRPDNLEKVQEIAREAVALRKLFVDLMNHEEESHEDMLKIPEGLELFAAAQEAAAAVEEVEVGLAGASSSSVYGIPVDLI